MECDNQFFLSSSVNPHSALMRARISIANSTGPASINACGVAGVPSISSPSTPISPHSRYARSISAAITTPSIFSRTSLPASRYSAFRPISRILRANSIRLPNDTRAISNRTPGAVADSHQIELAYWLAERDIKFVSRRALRPAVLKFPLEARLAVVVLRNRRHHRRHVRPEQLVRLLPQLQHHRDRRPLPRRLIQRRRLRVRHLENFEVKRNLPHPRRDALRVITAEFLHP